jgi:hypothetical protein
VIRWDEVGLICNTHERDEEFAQNDGGENLNVNEHLVEVGENIIIYLKYEGVYRDMYWIELDVGK